MSVRQAGLIKRRSDQPSGMAESEKTADSSTHMRVALSRESEATAHVVEQRWRSFEPGVRKDFTWAARLALTPGDAGSLVVAQIIRSARGHTCDNYFFLPM